jgi:hypothetical protein
MTVLKKSILHNNLPDIQGGEIDEYYHLSQEKYDIVSGLTNSGSGTIFLSDDGTYKAAGGVQTYTRRSDYVGLISYQGFAEVGSLETDEVWTITKIVTDAPGNIISSVQTDNVKWSERLTL